MKLSILILLIALFTVQLVYAQAADLFISEYLEGSSNNKAIEIYNGTGADVDLSNYMIKKATNGGGWSETNYTFPENSVISSYDVWVIANSSADATILNVADVTLPSASYNYLMAFNGDDAIGFFKDGTLLDIIGNPNEDPGSGWAVAGTDEATFNHTLIRKSSVSQGNADWNASAGTTADNSEWEVFDMDYMTNLGQHTFNGAPDITPPIILSLTPTSPTIIELVFSEEVTEETATNIDNYTITGLIVNSVSLQNDNKTVILTTSEQGDQTLYVITVNNIQDLAGNTILPNTTMTFHGYHQIYYTPIRNIQDSLSVYEGQSVTVKGIVTIGDALLHPGKTQFYIQDESGRGIQIYNSNPLSHTYVRGDYVAATGTIGLYTGTGDKYHDVQVENASVTLLSEGENLPSSYNLVGSEALEMNGTWAKVVGTISDIWDASSQYNFYKFTATMDNGAEVDLMFWNSAVSPNLISQYVIGDKVNCYGVTAFYSGTPQLLCGYAEDIDYYTPGDEIDYVSFDSEPQANQEITAIFNDANEKFTDVYIYWKKNNEILFNTYLTEASADSTTFSYRFDPQKAGTRIQFYYKAYKDTVETVYPDLITLDFPASSLVANLSIPAKPFNPSVGERFHIVFSGSSGNKAILRIYNIEGKLKLTLYNAIIQSYSGIVDIEWDGKDKNKNILPIGLYICYLEVYDRDSGKTKTDKAPIMIGTQLK